jgi:hypothetical protein
LISVSCSPVFQYRNKNELSQKLNWQASENRLELILQNGTHIKPTKVELLSDSLSYQSRDTLANHTISYDEMKYLQFKNYEKSMFWGGGIGLVLGILQWNSIASSYEGGSEKTQVPLLVTGIYVGIGTLAGSLIGINEKVTPEKIRKSDTK